MLEDIGLIRIVIIPIDVSHESYNIQNVLHITFSFQ